MVEIFQIFTAFGPHALAPLATLFAVYMLLKFFGAQQDKMISAHERASAVLVTAIDKLGERIDNISRDLPRTR